MKVLKPDIFHAVCSFIHFCESLRVFSSCEDATLFLSRSDHFSELVEQNVRKKSFCGLLMFFFALKQCCDDAFEVEPRRPWNPGVVSIKLLRTFSKSP